MNNKRQQRGNEEGMDKIGEQIKNMNNKLTSLINDVTQWLEETEPKEEGHDTI